MHPLFKITTKLDSRARKCVLLGYKSGVKGEILLDFNNRQIFLSRNVIYHEDVFPYKGSQAISKWNYFSPSCSNFTSVPTVTETTNIELDSSEDIADETAVNDQQLRKSTREKWTPAYLSENIYVVTQVITLSYILSYFSVTFLL